MAQQTIDRRINETTDAIVTWLRGHQPKRWRQLRAYTVAEIRRELANRRVDRIHQRGGENAELRVQYRLWVNDLAVIAGRPLLQVQRMLSVLGLPTIDEVSGRALYVPLNEVGARQDSLRAYVREHVEHFFAGLRQQPVQFVVHGDGAAERIQTHEINRERSRFMSVMFPKEWDQVNEWLSLGGTHDQFMDDPMTGYRNHARIYDWFFDALQKGVDQAQVQGRGMGDMAAIFLEQLPIVEGIVDINKIQIQQWGDQFLPYRRYWVHQFNEALGRAGRSRGRFRTEEIVAMFSFFFRTIPLYPKVLQQYRLHGQHAAMAQLINQFTAHISPNEPLGPSYVLQAGHRGNFLNTFVETLPAQFRRDFYRWMDMWRTLSAVPEAPAPPRTIRFNPTESWLHWRIWKEAYTRVSNIEQYTKKDHRQHLYRPAAHLIGEIKPQSLTGHRIPEGQTYLRRLMDAAYGVKDFLGPRSYVEGVDAFMGQPQTEGKTFSEWKDDILDSQLPTWKEVPVFGSLPYGKKWHRTFPDYFRAKTGDEVAIPASIQWDQEGFVELSADVKFNLMAAVRQVCFRITSLWQFARAAGIEVPSIAWITTRAGIDRQDGQWHKASWSYISERWVVESFRDPNNWGNSVAVLFERIWHSLINNLENQSYDHLLERYGGDLHSIKGQNFMVGELWVRSDYWVRWWRQVLPAQNFDLHDERSLFPAIYWLTADRSASMTYQWNVADPRSECYEIAQYKTYRESLVLGSLVERPCLFACIAFLARSQLYAMKHLESINKGLVCLLVECLNKEMNCSVGVYRSSFPGFSTIVQGARHLWLSPSHVTVMSWETTRGLWNLEMLKRKTSGGSHFSSARYLSDVRLRRVRDPEPEISRIEADDFDPDEEEDTVAPTKMPAFWCNQITISDVWRRNVLFWDIECFAVKGSVQTAYLSVMIGWVGDQWREYVHLMDLPTDDVLSGWVAAIVEINRAASQRGERIKVYTYNGMKYEMRFVFLKLLEFFPILQSMGELSATKGIMLSQFLSILDVRHLYPTGSLLSNSRQVCKSYVKEDYPIGNIVTYQQFTRHSTAVVGYCFRDCLATFQLCQRWYLTAHVLGSQMILKKRMEQSFRPTDKREVLPLDSLFQIHTCPQLAVAFFCWYFVGQLVIKNTQPDEVTDLQRKHYSGGLVEVFMHQVTEQVYDFDVNSMYPWVMTLPLPWYYIGPRQIEDLSLEIVEIMKGDRQLTFYYVQRADMRWCHTSPLKTRSGAVYPSTVRDVWMWGAQIRACNPFFLRLGSCIDYSSYHRDLGIDITAAREYVQMFYQLKRTCPRDQPGRKNMIKLFLNSLYGKWGQRRFPKTHFVHNDAYEEMPVNFEDQCYDQGGFRQILSTPKTGGHVGDNVRLAAFITARARSRLVETMLAVGRQHVWYCDTDSIFVSYVGRSILEDKGQLHEDRLGKYKLQSFSGAESIFVDGYFLSRKCYLLVNKDDNILFKAKGMNWTVGEKMPRAAHQQLLIALRNKMPAALESLSARPQRSIYLEIEIMCNRWIWNAAKTGVIIEQYLKKLNLNPKRALDTMGRTLPLTQYQTLMYK